MSHSRRALYAAGEPLGDGATRREGGRLICGGGGGSSKSSTAAQDSRLVTGSGSAGVSGNQSSLDIEFADYSRTTNTDARSFDQTTTLTDSRSSSYSSSSSVSDNDNIYTYNYSLDDKVAKDAFEFAKAADATSGQGFQGVLQLAERLFDGGRDLVEGARDAVTDAYKDAYTTSTAAQVDKQGAIDQKTMIVIAGLGVAALWALKKG